MNLDPEDVRSFAETVSRFESVIDRIHKDQKQVSNTSTNTIQTGGAPIWVATTACIVMLAVYIQGQFWMSHELTRIDADMKTRKEENERTQSYVASIFVQMPKIKELVEEYMKNKKDSEKK